MIEIMSCSNDNLSELLEYMSEWIKEHKAHPLYMHGDNSGTIILDVIVQYDQGDSEWWGVIYYRNESKDTSSTS